MNGIVFYGGNHIETRLFKAKAKSANTREKIYSNWTHVRCVFCERLA